MSNRKSTGGVARRVVQKPHIPYRGDDLGVGKKTGVAVERVDRKSDGFEPFQEVVDRMDRRTPPRTKMNGRARRRSPSPVQRSAEDDGEQELSMDLVDSEH
jgi:centromere protein C